MTFSNFLESAAPIRFGESIQLAKTSRKRTTPAKGEEAEVVVYQSRGVGLMHTRPKSSAAYYTLARGRKRKYWKHAKGVPDRVIYRHKHLSRMVISHDRLQTVRRRPFMLSS